MDNSVEFFNESEAIHLGGVSTLRGFGGEVFDGIHDHTDNMHTKAAFAVLGCVLIQVGSRDSEGVEGCAVVKDFYDKSIVILGAYINKKFSCVVEMIGVTNEVGTGFINSQSNFMNALLGKSKFTRFILHELADSLQFGCIAGSRQALVYEGSCFGHSVFGAKRSGCTVTRNNHSDSFALIKSLCLCVKERDFLLIVYQNFMPKIWRALLLLFR